GRLGYLSEAQDSLAVSYNSIESYTACLHDVLTKPYAPYEAIGIRDGDGNYRQLATSLLQIENEFYSTIRPKRVIRPGERPLHALRERGGPGFGARRHRVPRRARGGRQGRGRSRVTALGAHPRRDARTAREFLLPLRARAVARAREDAAKRAAARRSRSALRAPCGGIDQETKGDRGGRPRRFRDL